MKNRIYLKIGFLLMLSCCCINCSKDKSGNLPQDGPVSFYATPELYELTNEWADVYNKLNPDEKIVVLKRSESSVVENLEQGSNLSFVSGTFDSVIYARSLWKVVIGREVIVPIINAENPLLEKIISQGISPAEFARILHNPETTSWGSILGTGNTMPATLFVKEDQAITAGIARFLDEDQITFDGNRTMGAEDVIAAVQQDRYAIGICKITDIIDPSNQNIREEIKILPIDKNGNGAIDYKEDVYASLDAFTRGVWIGKYPRELSNDIYSVSASHPTNQSEIAFLAFAITNGQALLDNYGFRILEENEQMAQLKWINSYNIEKPGSVNYAIPEKPGLFVIPFALLLTIILATLILFITWIRFRIRRRAGVPVRIPFNRPALHEDFLEISPGLCYDKTHTWAYMDEDGLVKVGIDDFLQRITGPLTRIKMKSPGERINKGKKAVSIIQDGKQLDINAPVSGTIRELNTMLSSDISLLNSSPYSKGWIYKIEPTNWLKEVQFLIMGNNYRSWLKTEFQRLKDFFAESIRPETVGYAHVLQDGGELKEHLLEDFGPKVWEDFQTNFIDTSV